MKVLSLTYEYLPIGGGGSRVAAAVNEELVRLGDEVTVLTSGMKGPACRGDGQRRGRAPHRLRPPAASLHDRGGAARRR